MVYYVLYYVVLYLTQVNIVYIEYYMFEDLNYIPVRRCLTSARPWPAEALGGRWGNCYSHLRRFGAEGLKVDSESTQLRSPVGSEGFGFRA